MGKHTAIARATRNFGRGRFDVVFVASKHVSLVAIRRRGVVFDAAFVPALREPTGHAMLYLVLEGVVEAGVAPTPRFDAPRALLLEEDDFEGAGERERMPFRNSGEVFVAIEVRIRRHLVPPTERGRVLPIEISEDAWAAARRLATLSSDDGEVERAAGDLLRSLAAARVITDADVAWAPPEPDGVAASRTYMPSVFAPEKVGSLDALAEVAGVSVRSVARGLELFATHFRSPFTGWRETTRRVRLKLAVMALSVDDLPIREVARAAGFGSVEAMARAFRDAEAPAPSVIRQALREARTRMEGDAAAGG